MSTHANFPRLFMSIRFSHPSSEAHPHTPFKDIRQLVVHVLQTQKEDECFTYRSTPPSPTQIHIPGVFSKHPSVGLFCLFIGGEYVFSRSVAQYRSRTQLQGQGKDRGRLGRDALHIHCVLKMDSGAAAKKSWATAIQRESLSSSPPLHRRLPLFNGVISMVSRPRCPGRCHCCQSSCLHDVHPSRVACAASAPSLLIFHLVAIISTPRSSSSSS